MANSPTYDLFARAIIERRQIVCVYEGHPRELCPIILGHSRGEEKALTFQFGGSSNSGLPPGGQWRCLWLTKFARSRCATGPGIADRPYPAARLRRDRRSRCQSREPLQAQTGRGTRAIADKDPARTPTSAAQTMTEIYIDADACPVRDEVYRVAERLSLQVFVVFERLAAHPAVARSRTSPWSCRRWRRCRGSLDRRAYRPGAIFASPAISRSPRAASRRMRAPLAPNGKIWTKDNIGNALAGREVRAICASSA